MSLPSLQLRTFGGLAVERDGVPVDGMAVRRRPLALLAYVAAHGDVGASRDRVLAVLWPESSDERARNSLKQAVFAIRQALGGGVLATPGATMRVDRAHLSVDALDFADLLDRDALDDAAALYRGPFLDGVAVPGLDELERWIAAERARYGRAAATAFEMLAQRAQCAGDHVAAVSACRRRAAIDPYSAAAASGLMRALRDAGDRTAALEHWRVHRLLVREELGAEPDPEVRTLADEIRASLTPARAIPAAPPEQEAAARDAPLTPPAAAPDAPPLTQRAFPARLLDTGARRAAAQPRGRLPGRVRRAPLALVALTVLAAAALAPAVLGRFADAADDAAPTASPALVLVLPFSTVNAGASDKELGRAVADLVSVGLHGTGPWRTVAPSALSADDVLRGERVLSADEARSAAARHGAGRYLRGEVVRDGARLHLVGSLHDPGGAVVARASTEGGTLSGAADALARALIGDLLDGPASRAARVAAATASSASALRAWLAGEASARAFRLGDAAAAFERAVALDSSFALGWHRLATVAAARGDAATADAAASRALAQASSLPQPERALLEAWGAERVGQFEEAEARMQSVVGEAPDHAEAWTRLGLLRFHHGAASGAHADGPARDALERALSIDPAAVEPAVHLARLAAHGGRADAEVLLARARRSAADGRALTLAAARAYSLAAEGPPERALGALGAGDAEFPLVTDFLRAGDDVARVEALARSARVGTPSGERRALALRLEALTAAARGRRLAAGEALDSLAAVDSAAAATLRVHLDGHPLLGRPVAARARPTGDATADALAGQRWHRAERMLAAGRSAEAAEWYTSIGLRAAAELPYLAPARLRLAQIAGARGDRAGARAHALAFLALWAECDGPLRPIAEAVARGTPAGDGAR